MQKKKKKMNVCNGSRVMIRGSWDTVGTFLVEKNMAIFEQRKRNGKTVVRAKIRLTGFPEASATFEKKRDAVAWAGRIENEMREGRYDQNATAKAKTLGQAIDKYIEVVLPVKSKKARYISQQKAQLLWWKGKAGGYTLSNITPAVIVEIRDDLRKRCSSGTVNRYLAALSHLFTLLHLEWAWIHENPMLKVKKMKEPRGRVRFLSEAEREKLFKACKMSECKDLYTIVLVALYTGPRKNEILNLRWEDYDIGRNQIAIMETKNDERRTLYLRGRASEYFRALHMAAGNPTEGFVFATRTGQPLEVDKFWKKAVRSAGIKDFKFHDLRHTCASYLAMNGTSLAAIAELLGHKTLNMVKRYAHLSESHTAAQVEAMSSRFI